jgi:archaellum component FlaC|tara:strand:+ start:4746 stop:5018 length:273 start_codon:yes stop_codon:yes gene_type:complete
MSVTDILIMILGAALTLITSFYWRNETRRNEQILDLEHELEKIKETVQHTEKEVAVLCADVISSNKLTKTNLEFVSKNIDELKRMILERH